MLQLNEPNYTMSRCLTTITCALLVFQTCSGSTFCPVTSPLRDFIYIADSPTKTISDVTKADCATQCAFYTAVYAVTSPTCRCFNYNVSAANCALYTFEPSNFAIDRSGAVSAYQFSERPLAGLFPTVTSGKCSASYEYGGQIFPGDCRKFQPTCSGQMQFGCSLPNGMPAYCIHEIADKNVNLALNKPAYQRSTYANYFASYANDGSLNSLSCTLQNTLSWWAVDLEEPYLIATVVVVNNQSVNTALPLNNVYVKLSNVQPIVGLTVTDSTSTLCAQYNGSVAPLATATFDCGQTLLPFRYVIVQSSSAATAALCLTEVSVYGSLVPPHPIVSSNACSYPYTYEGVLYYRCMQNVSSATTSSYPFACLTTNRTLSTCYSPADYVAQVTNYKVNVSGLDDQMTLSVSGWIVFLSRQTGSVDGNWDLPWLNYVNGFGFNASYLWLGLERIHQLTTSGNWRLRLEYQYSTDSTWHSEEYWTFTVADSSTYYTIHFDGYSGDDNDLLHGFYTTAGNTDGMQFTTSDNMRNLQACAAGSDIRCGWWFNHCGYLFPNAKLARVYVDSSQYIQIKEAHVMMKSR